MENILDLMKTVTDETGVPPEFSVRMNELGFWIAKVTERDQILCDRQGERFLVSSSEDLDEAIDELDQLCA